MKAAQWTGTRSITLNAVPRPAITAAAAADAIVRITHCTICGSDLHMYARRHERRHAARRHHGPRGDRVVVLPVIACGDCAYCARGEYSLCDKTNPSEAMAGMYGHRLAGIFGYSHLTGGYAGDQAEYCRVPNARI